MTTSLPPGGLVELVARATPGPWELTEEPSWPFGIEINAGENAVISMRRHCYGTGDETLEDIMRGKAYGPKERPEAVALNARQIADAQLIALAPTLALQVEAMRKAIERLLAHRVGELPHRGWLRDNDEVRAAVADLAAILSKGDPA